LGFNDRTGVSDKIFEFLSRKFVEDSLIDVLDGNIFLFEKVSESFYTKVLSLRCSDFGKYSLEGYFVEFLHVDSTE
jgi:hypothetical protein